MTPFDKTAAPLSILVLGTCDTKLSELLYLRSQILSHAEDASITLVDVGKSPVSNEAISIPQHELLEKYGSSSDTDLSKVPRSQVTQIMTECAKTCLQHLYSESAVHGVISIGGSCGTSITSAAMRHALPFLIPKVIVSTMASGDTAPFVGESDITLMYSIVDITGSNSILDGILDNAAGGIVGMARAFQKRQLSQTNHNTSNDPQAKQKKKKRIGITMFGVTTPCVDTIRTYLTSPSSPLPNSELYTFHATGHGGLAMERLIASHALDAVIDLTTTEIADHIVGGCMSAGPHRLEAALKAGIPYIISVGACDVVNFGPRDTVPQKFVDRGRKLYEHNQSVTVMRTDKEECKLIGEFLVKKVRAFCKNVEMVRVVLPVGGVSALSMRGEVFEDREADEVLFGVVERGLEGMGVGVVRDERGVNERGFAGGLVERLVEVVESEEEAWREEAWREEAWGLWMGIEFS
ncbi:MAG: hypothetical protein Q9178_003365 [Gyalolechia marmorata]